MTAAAVFFFIIPALFAQPFAASVQSVQTGSSPEYTGNRAVQPCNLAVSTAASEHTASSQNEESLRAVVSQLSLEEKAAG